MISLHEYKTAAIAPPKQLTKYSSGSHVTNLMICLDLTAFQNPGSQSMIEPAALTPPSRTTKIVPRKAKVEIASRPSAYGAWAQTAKSETISKNLRQKTFQCVNPDCGEQFIANLSLQ